MDKYFICLANSYKRNGRCIAGVEVTISQDYHWKIVRNNDGSPHWVRPIDQHTEYGEVLEGEARYIPLLSVVRLSEVIPCPHESHSEDVNYMHMIAIGMIKNNREVLEQLSDNVHYEVFYTKELAISPEVYAKGNYSLMMIHPENIQFQEDLTKNRARYRMLFTYHGTNYDFSITDPVFYEQTALQPQLLSSLKDVYLTLSIGLEYEGRHHKLIAGLIIPSDMSTHDNPFEIIHTGQLQEKKVCPFTKKELSGYKRAFVVPGQEGLSVCIKNKDGGDYFIKLDFGITVEPWKRINLRRTQIVTYSDSMGKEIKRLRTTIPSKSEQYNNETKKRYNRICFMKTFWYFRRFLLKTFA